MRNSFLRITAAVARALPGPLRSALYRLGPLTRLTRRALNRAAPLGISETVVAAGPLAGARLLLDLQSEKDLWLGTYEPQLLAAIEDLARPGMTAFDVGANIGYITVLLARRVGPEGKVFAFEPLPANLERLRANLALNGLERLVAVIPCGVTDAVRSAAFFVHASGGMGKVEGSAGRDEHYPGRITVETTDLDTFVYARGNPAPSLVKVDIEGGEVLAFAGMRRLLREARPILLVELHGPEARARAQDELGEARYRLCHIRHGFPQIERPDSLAWKAYVAAFPEENHG
jgi:FkbM family methyltransferase